MRCRALRDLMQKVRTELAQGNTSLVDDDNASSVDLGDGNPRYSTQISLHTGLLKRGCVLVCVTTCACVSTRARMCVRAHVRVRKRPTVTLRRYRECVAR